MISAAGSNEESALVDGPADGNPDGPVDAGPPAVPLLVPRDPIVGPLTRTSDLLAWARDFASGPAGPVAIDAERASGFRYGGRAYLVQLRRPDLGTALLDPIALGGLQVLDQPLARSEWVLHAATQDLPCLADAGIRPRRLFDTELAGRLAGFPRVGLAPLVERMLGLQLRKGHGAADWSTRPLPHDWLIYAALDVEVLVDLRDAMEEELSRQGKLDWAHEEFAALVSAAPPAPRPDPWRRTSGVHKITDRRALAVVRELWLARDALARNRDVAPHRVLPDSAIVAAAAARPVNIPALVSLPVFAGRMQRRNADLWLSAVSRALAQSPEELPPPRFPGDGPPAPAKWASRDAVAAARLQSARSGLAELSERVHTPVENLLSPDLVRRLLWTPPDDDGSGLDVALAQVMAGRGARRWQIELVEPVLRQAILTAAGR
jgi:ribonuclease D